MLHSAISCRLVEDFASVYIALQDLMVSEHTATPELRCSGVKTEEAFLLRAELNAWALVSDYDAAIYVHACMWLAECSQISFQLFPEYSLFFELPIILKLFWE